jgi:hypothetical protein
MNDKIYKALQYLKNDDWEEAHLIAQSKEGNPDFDLLHAFLHRWEGDTSNAKYWYSICNLNLPEIPLIEELNQLMERYKPAGK